MIDAAQKATRMYDTLMKQGSFAASQNKVEESNFVDSIGELVAMCEEQGFIPRYYTEGPQDIVDKVILDMQHYTRELVVGELGLGNMIENAFKGIQREKEMIEASGDEEGLDEQAAEDAKLFDYDNEPLTTEDMDEYSDYLLEQEAADAQIYKDLEG